MGDKMGFNELKQEVNNLKLNDKEEIANIVDKINVTSENFNQWVDDVFSEKVNEFDMQKLPYIIDELYQSNDKLKFMLCCMLLEATCHQLAFVTNLEDYPLFAQKFETLTGTLARVYDLVDNGIANCMSLIIIRNDPEFTFFDDELKNIIVGATKRKLSEILNYLKTANVNQIVYEDLEVIVDMACHLNDKEINKLVEEIDHLDDNQVADIYIMKYKIINHIELLSEKINRLKQDEENLWLLYNMMEKLGVNTTYLNDVAQEQIAKSDMLKWLKYPTELGSFPDEISLLGSFKFNDTKCFAFKFQKHDFKVKGELLAIAGGYPEDKVSSISTGYTFSKFEPVADNWQQQAIELANFIDEAWKNNK